MDTGKRIHLPVIAMMKPLCILCYWTERTGLLIFIKIYNKNATKENMIKYLKDFTGISEKKIRTVV